MAATAILAHFTAADNTAIGSYTPDAGAAWAALSGAAGILGDRAAFTSAGVMAADAGESDGVITAVVGLPASGALASVVFRGSDATNYLRTSLIQSSKLFNVSKVVAGASTTLATMTLAALAAGDHDVRITLSGSAIAVTLDDVYVLAVTETFNQAATLHGFQSTATTPTFDDFQFLTAGDFSRAAAVGLTTGDLTATPLRAEYGDMFGVTFSFSPATSVAGFAWTFRAWRGTDLVTTVADGGVDFLVTDAVNGVAVLTLDTAAVFPGDGFYRYTLAVADAGGNTVRTAKGPLTLA